MAVFDDNVSRETSERLNEFCLMVKKWNERINLISRNTVPNIWERHVVDSLQLVSLIDRPVNRWVDLGSGGGFPAIVLAIQNADVQFADEIALVESDVRKSVFLETVIRELGLNAFVMRSRIENIPDLAADVVSARALASLTQLLGFSVKHGKPESISLFPKGKKWQTEVAEARICWQFEYDVYPSKTSDDSVILSISGVRRAGN